MKKKLLPGIVALAVLLIAGLGMNRSMASYGDLSDVALQNVLALADGEDGGEGWDGPAPGEWGENAKKCGSLPLLTPFSFFCDGRPAFGINVSFECVSSGDYCEGTVGYEFSCGGENFKYTSVDRNPCS